MWFHTGSTYGPEVNSLLGHSSFTLQALPPTLKLPLAKPHTSPSVGSDAWVLSGSFRDINVFSKSGRENPIRTWKQKKRKKRGRGRDGEEEEEEKEEGEEEEGGGRRRKRKVVFPQSCGRCILLRAVLPNGRQDTALKDSASYFSMV